MVVVETFGCLAMPFLGCCPPHPRAQLAGFSVDVAFIVHNSSGEANLAELSVLPALPSMVLLLLRSWGCCGSA